MKHPYVTVGITVKNSAGTMKACLDSVLKSSYRNFEVLVVDAFSTDGTWEILRGYGKKINAIKKRGNISVGRNEIIRRARGELIAFTDADCIVDGNWLKNLVAAFLEKNIVAAGGFCGTAKNSNYLQSLIGRELEDRFKHFPKFVSRLPFMNICVRADAAKKNLLDENLGAAEDADFGYRLSKIGKIIYVPSAEVRHNHRAGLLSFFRQQFNYGKFAPVMYSKFVGRAGGDHISKPTMVAQPLLFLLGIFFLLASLFFQNVFLLSALFFSMLGIIYIHDSMRLSRSLADFFSYLGIFFIRTVAWSAGFFWGLKNFLVKK